MAAFHPNLPSASVAAFDPFLPLAAASYSCQNEPWAELQADPGFAGYLQARLELSGIRRRR